MAITIEEMSRTGTGYWKSALIAGGSTKGKKLHGDCLCCRDRLGLTTFHAMVVAVLSFAPTLEEGRR